MSSRCSNLDALRCLAMFLIVLGHFFTHGCGKSVYSRLDVMAATSVTVLGVDLFFLLSGYFSLLKERVNWKRLLGLWGQTAFYGILLAVVFCICTGGRIGLRGWVGIVAGLLDRSQYWFMTVYAVLCLASPYINRLLNSLSKQEYEKLLLGMMVLFSIIPTVFPKNILLNPVFNDSFVWALTMYCWGGYFRRFGNESLPKKTSRASWIYLASFGMLFASKILMPLLVDRFCSGSKLRVAFSMYCSPLVCFSAITLFAVFYRIKNCPNFFSWIAPSICGIYLIHDNNFIRTLLWREWLKVAQWEGSLWLLPVAIGLSLVIFAACLLVEKLRSLALGCLADFVKRAKGASSQC